MNKRFWMRVSLVAGLLMSGQALAWENEVPHAAPYVDKALSQPIATLYKTAHDTLESYDSLTLGLALLAGRGTDGNFSEADEKALAVLNARIAPEVEAYLKRRPKDDHTRVDWRKKLEVTQDELNVVERYEAAYLPEFWLGLAMSQAKITKATVATRPIMSGMGVMNGGAVSSRYTRSTLIEWNLYNTATQCVVAVRKAAGYSIVPLNDMPLSIRLLRNYIAFDAEHRVTEDLQPKSRYKGLKGAAACGTPEQFDAYVAKLKAAD